jgi:hypothetical protein
MAWDATTSTLIFGENDAVLVDTLTTADEAEALARWIELHHRNLTTIYVTHMPSIDLVVGSDVFYNQCHLMVAAFTPTSRVNWIDRIRTAEDTGLRNLPPRATPRVRSGARSSP